MTHSYVGPPLLRTAKFAGRIHMRRVIEPRLNFQIGSLAIPQMEVDKKIAGTPKRADSFQNSIKEFLNSQFQIFDKKSESEENPMYYWTMIVAL